MNQNEDLRLLVANISQLWYNPAKENHLLAKTLLESQTAGFSDSQLYVIYYAIIFNYLKIAKIDKTIDINDVKTDIEKWVLHRPKILHTTYYKLHKIDNFIVIPAAVGLLDIKVYFTPIEFPKIQWFYKIKQKGKAKSCTFGSWYEEIFFKHYFTAENFGIKVNCSFPHMDGGYFLKCNTPYIAKLHSSKLSFLHQLTEEILQLLKNTNHLHCEVLIGGRELETLLFGLQKTNKFNHLLYL